MARGVMDEEIRHIDLCSGIGGFGLAAGWAGAATGRNVRTVAFCEIDPFCQAVLRHHWPGVPIYDDIKTFDYEGGCDLLTAGYPCTPFSVAGKQKGAADDRFLWPSVLEIVKRKRPTFCLFENVPGHISLGLDNVLLDLENEGYAARPLVIPACSKNSPHRRDRVWICAKNVGDAPDDRRNWGAAQAGRKRKTDKSEQPESSFRGEPRRSSEDVAGGRQKRSAIEQVGDQAHGIPGWLAGSWERGVPRLEKKQEMRREKLAALGNSIVPQVAAEIMEAIFRNWE
jgi:DNA (cytosine-5)-methyltransferase 1